MPHFSGFSEPTYTQIPNEWFALLPQIETEAEDKVTQIVMRYTFGFHRRSAELSISFLEVATGLSRPAVIAGIKAGVKRGTIKRVRRQKGDQRGARIEINIVKGSKANLLATSQKGLPAAGKKGLPELVNGFNPRNKKAKNSFKEKFSLHPPEETKSRRPVISGRLAGVVSKKRKEAK